jgi:hypothetical protein
MQCGGCGADVSPGERYCTECGTPLSGPRAPTIAGRVVAAGHGRGIGTTGVLLVIGAALFLGVGAGGLYYVDQAWQQAQSTAAVSAQATMTALQDQSTIMALRNEATMTAANDAAQATHAAVAADNGLPTPTAVPPVITSLSGARGVAVDKAGNLYIADTYANRVLRVPAGGGPPTTVAIGLHNPFGVAVDRAGNLCIADTYANRVIRMPAGGGPPTPVAGDHTPPGGIAVAAAMLLPCLSRRAGQSANAPGWSTSEPPRLAAMTMET